MTAILVSKNRGAVQTSSLSIIKSETILRGDIARIID
jgi:hypothetical protein